MSDLSEQHLMDCAKDQCYADSSGNWCAYGCSGAWPQPYFDWTVNQNGGRFEQESCTPYHAYEKECQPKEDCIYQEAKLDGFHVDYESNEEDLKYLVYEGPVLVALNVSIITRKKFIFVIYEILIQPILFRHLILEDIQRVFMMMKDAAKLQKMKIVDGMLIMQFLLLVMVLRMERTTG